MAASAKASLPFMSTLSAISHLFFYRDCSVRTHKCTTDASGALILVNTVSRMITLLANDFPAKLHDALRAYIDTESTAFAKG
jgi:hypothetical protein